MELELTIKTENDQFVVYNGTTKLGTFDKIELAEEFKDAVEEKAKNAQMDLQFAQDNLSHAQQEVDEAAAMVKTDDLLVLYGDGIKAAGDGKVEGYLVRWDSVDQQGDYFTKSTEFGNYSSLPMMYHHGFSRSIGKRKIGELSIKADETGLFARGKLNLRDAAERDVYNEVKAGKMGWSSGAAPNSVITVKTARGNEIQQWFLAEGSITPKPAEPKNYAVAVKSLMAEEARTQTSIPAYEIGAVVGAVLYQHLKK